MKVFYYILAILCLVFAVMTFVTKAGVQGFTGGILWLYMAFGNLSTGTELSLYD